MAIFNAPKVFKLVILKILFTMRLCNFKFSFEILQLPLVPSTKLPPPSDTNSSANIQIFDPPPPPANASPPLTSQTGGRYMLCNLDNTELGCSKVLADFSFMQTGINVKIQVPCFCSFLEGSVL